MKPTKTEKKKLTSDQGEKLLSVLKIRFEKNMHRHKGISWDKVKLRLEKIQPHKKQTVFFFNLMIVGGSKLFSEIA